MARVTCASENGVAVITLDDGKANAMNPDFFAELNRAMDQVEEEGAGAVIFTGRPGFFSGGLDLKLLPMLARDDLQAMTRTFAQTMLRIFQFPAPTIAALTGHAIAGGAILSFACDARIAVDGRSRLQMNEVVIGIPLPSWMILIASSAVPSRWITELLLHARVYSPREAYERGIVGELLDEGADVVARAREIAGPLLGLNRGAYATSKQRLRSAAAQSALDLLERELPG